MDSHTLRLVALSFSPWHRAYAAREAEYEREVLQMMCILPGTHRYAAVEAALNAAGVRPRDIYESLAAEQRTLALARFYEALGLVE